MFYNVLEIQAYNKIRSGNSGASNEADVSGLPLKEQAELKAAWSAFMAKYK